MRHEKFERSREGPGRETRREVIEVTCRIGSFSITWELDGTTNFWAHARWSIWQHFISYLGLFLLHWLLGKWSSRPRVSEQLISKLSVVDPQSSYYHRFSSRSASLHHLYPIGQPEFPERMEEWKTLCWLLGTLTVSNVFLLLSYLPYSLLRDLVTSPQKADMWNYRSSTFQMSCSDTENMI